MAFCPKCSNNIDRAVTACTSCGYDFPLDENTLYRPLLFSPLADAALLVATVLSAIGCVIAVLSSVVALFQQAWLVAFVYCPIAFFYQLALVIVFARTKQR